MGSKFSLTFEFGGILKVITSTAFFFYAFYNLWKMSSYIKGLVLGADETNQKELYQLFNLKKGEKREPQGVRIHPKTSAKQNVGKSQKVLSSIVNSRSNIDALISKLNTLELIEKVLFDEDDKA